MVRLLVDYFDRDTHKGLVPVHRTALKRAHRLLGNYCCAQGDKVLIGERRELQFLGRRWSGRLWAAGIDPETLEVWSTERWALAWKYLLEHNDCFHPEKIEAQLAAGETVPLEEQFLERRIVVDPHWKEHRLPKGGSCVDIVKGDISV
jgi:hypothetical protein